MQFCLMENVASIAWEWVFKGVLLPYLYMVWKQPRGKLVQAAETGCLESLIKRSEHSWVLRRNRVAMAYVLALYNKSD